MQVVYGRTRVTGTEDVAVTTHDFWSESAGDFTTAWMDSIALAFLTMFVSGGVAHQRCVLREIRFYDDYDGDGSPGEVDYVKGYTNTGAVSSGAMLPPQVACSVTELLGPDSRKHWGRFYLPGIPASALELDGTYSATYVNSLAGLVNTMYDAWSTADYYPVVFVHGPPGFNPTRVTEVRVDNIPDIIRRRRYEQATLRVTNSVD